MNQKSKKIRPHKIFLLICKYFLRPIIVFFLTGEGGILIHCISGWDRTPLFISLLRLSLWAVSQWWTAMAIFSCDYVSSLSYIGWQSSLVPHSSWDPLLHPGLWLAHLCTYYCMCTTCSILNIIGLKIDLPWNYLSKIRDFHPDQAYSLTLE